MIDAMKQALEALEESVDMVRNEYESNWRHGIPTRKAQLDSLKDGVKAHEQAITSLRQAIAEAEKQEPVAQCCLWGVAHDCHAGDGCRHVERLIKAARPVPKREPLTDEQRMELWRITEFRGNGGQVDWFIEGTRAAEAAHGIKGEA